MEVDFVDQDDAFAMEGVFRSRICYRHSPGQVANHRKCALLSVRELVHEQLFTILEYYHARWTSRYPETGEPEQKPFDCLSYCAQLTITI